MSQPQSADQQKDDRPRSNTPHREPIGYRPIPPDGGWGWMVVLGAFLIHVFADGFVYSFGIMVVELLETFQEGRSLTSWIVSLLTGLTLGVGPIASAATNRFGCRATSMTGACIASFGCFLSYFANSVLFLMISVGVVMGFGFGLMYCPAIVIVTMYFEERRSLATGIAVCGAGIGTFIFAPLSNLLIQTYTWRGAFLVYSGLILNGVVCGAMFRPLEFEPIYADDEEEMNGVQVDPITGSTEEFKHRDAQDSSRSCSPLARTDGSRQQTTENGNRLSAAEGRGSHENLQTQEQTERKMSEEDRLKAFSHTHIGVEDPMSEQLYRTMSVRAAERPLRRASRPEISRRAVRRRGISESTGYLSIKDVFYHGSVTNVAQFKADPDRYRSIVSLHAQHHDGKHRDTDTTLTTTAADGAPMRSADRTMMRTESVRSLSAWQDAIKVFKQMADFSLLKDPIFLLFATSNFLTSVGFNAPLIFLPDRAENELGMSKAAASWVLSAFGVANTFGRVLIGFICDRPLGPFKATQRPAYNRLWIYNISITFCGIFTVLSPRCTTFPELVFYAGSFGFTLSCYVCLTSVLLVDLVGLDKLTNGFGIILLFAGVATIIGPPLAGWLVDISGSYDGAFYFSGVGIFISGVMMYCIPCFRTLPVDSDQRNRLRSKSDDDTLMT